MKKLASYNHHIITSTNHFIILFSLSFLLFTSCNAPNKQEVTQTDITIRTDSLFVPTGNAELDSLLQLAAVAPVDTNLARLYKNIANIYEYNDLDLAKEYCWKLKNLSEKLNWNKGLYYFAINYQVLLNREGLTDSALVVLNEALELAKKEKDEIIIASLQASIGSIYMSLDLCEKALEYYLESIAVLEKNDPNNSLGNVYYMMCQLYAQMMSTDKAIEYGEKAIHLHPDNQYAFYSLAIAYGVIHQYEKAKFYFVEALK